MWKTSFNHEAEQLPRPVVDAERTLGLLFASDALEALLSEVEYEEELLKDYVMCVGYR